MGLAEGEREGQWERGVAVAWQEAYADVVQGGEVVRVDGGVLGQWAVGGGGAVQVAAVGGRREVVAQVGQRAVVLPLCAFDEFLADGACEPCAPRHFNAHPQGAACQSCSLLPTLTGQLKRHLEEGVCH